MNKLAILLKVYALNSLGINKARYSKDAKEKRKFISYLCLMAFSVLILAGVSFMYSFMMAEQLKAIGGMDLLLGIMMMATSLVTLLTTIYKGATVLFGFKDYDMLMSLPVKTNTIVISRIIMLYTMNLLFGFLVMIPAVIVYCLNVAVNWVFYPVFVICLLLIPVVPMVIATILSTLISIVASRFRRKNGLGVLLMVALFVAVMVLSFQMGNFMVDFGNIAQALMNTITHIYPLTQTFVDAVCKLNGVALLIFVAVAVVLTVAYALVIGKYFKKINTALTSSKARSNYKMTELKTGSAFSALVRRERKRYFSSSLYLLNTGVGMIMVTLLSVALLFFGAQVVEVFLEIPGFSQNIGKLVPFVVALFVGMSSTTASSISLEGKNLWILKSLPVSAQMILKSKLALNLLVTVPAVLLNGILLAISLKLNVESIAAALIFPSFYAVLIAQMGLALNLKNPNLEWKSEAVPIKQGMPVMLTMFGGMIFAIVPAILMFVLPTQYMTLILWVSVVLVALIDVLLYRHLMGKGAREFEALN